MGKKFIKTIPKIPIYKRNMYEIPKSYSEVYKKEGIADLDEQKALFYATQFGGFRFKRVPSYFENKQMFVEKWFRVKNENGFFQFKANSEYLSKFGSIEIEPLLRNRYKGSYWGRCFTKDFLLENSFSLEEGKRIEDLQDRLNEYYSSLRLSLTKPNSGITPEDRMDLQRFNSIPHFQYKPRAGGRLFHSGPGISYQRVSSNLRPFLTINGKRSTEIDITAATIQLLNIVSEKYAGWSSMSKKLLSGKDPYQFFLSKLNSSRSVGNKNGSLERDSLKDVLYTLIFSPMNSQKRNVNRRLKLLNQNYSYSDLENLFPKFFKMVRDVKSIPLNGGDDKCPPHIPIFKEESRYARRVLEKGCLIEGFPILPLHDSFISFRKDFPRLEKIVRDVSMELYGYVLAYRRKF